MRKLILILALTAGLLVPAAAVAGLGPSPGVACGPTCDPGGGYTGCKTVEASHSASAWLVYSVDHVIRVSYCKRFGVITSIGISAHYCTYSGFASCGVVAAFGTGGGVGSTWATFEAHAQWTVTPLGIYNNKDTLTLLVPTIESFQICLS